MWILKLAAIAAPIAATAYAGAQGLAELNERTEIRAVEEAALKRAARQALDASPLRFKQVVVGPGSTSEEMRFRARAAAPDGEWTTAYGVIGNDCPGGAAASGCWRLASLYVDGRAATPAGDVMSDAMAAKLAAPARPAAASATVAGSTVAGPASSGPAQSDPAPAAAQPATNATIVTPNGLAANSPAAAPRAPATASGSGGATSEAATSAAAAQTTAALDPAATDATPPRTAAAPAPEPVAASHAVRLSLVNARAAPSTDAEVLLQLPGDTGLLLLERQGGWGKFRVLDGEDRDQEVWVAFSVLRDA